VLPIKRKKLAVSSNIWNFIPSWYGIGEKLVCVLAITCKIYVRQTDGCLFVLGQESGYRSFC
jgi:hypothetical protein